MPEKQIEPVDDLMAMACALRFLADSFHVRNDYGPSKLLESIAKEVSETASLMDDERWGPGEKS